MLDNLRGTKYGDRHDVRDMGTDTELGRPNLLARWTCPSAGRAAQAGSGTQIWGQTRNLDGQTFDPPDLTKRRSDGSGRLWCPDLGTDTELRRPGFYPADLPERRPGCPSRLRHPDMGTGTELGRPDF
jgi:hypothetical protein